MTTSVFSDHGVTSRLSRYTGMLILVAVASACASARGTTPPTPTPPAPPDVAIEQKVAWLLRLEQQRVLRDAGAAAVPAGAAVRTLTPARTADLEALAVDPDQNVRRRAILAIGRVGLPEGAPAVATALADAKETEELRAIAAFSLGLIGGPEAIAALSAAARDPSALVRGAAIDALGMIGDPASAATIADASSACGPLLAPFTADDEPVPAPEVEACRLALFALVRLRNYDALARVALDAQGQPVSRWWPVAYALQRINDPRAANALVSLLQASSIYTRSFSMRGLASLRDARVVPAALAHLADTRTDVRLRVMAARALGAVGGPKAVTPLLQVLADPNAPRNLQVEVVSAMTAIGDPSVFDVMLDLLTDPWPALRAAAIAGAAKINPQGFLLVISNVERDREPSVRVALATALGELPTAQATPPLLDLVGDTDVRVQGPAIEALAKVKAPEAASRILDALQTPDFAVRATAARLAGEHLYEGGAARLIAAYERGESDVTYAARAAALEALAKYGRAAAEPTLRRGLSDREWPVRLRAAALLRELGDPTASPERPAPVRYPSEFFTSDRLLRPKFTPRAFIETRRGTIEIELNVIEAAFTTNAFIDLARAGFFNGLRVHRVVPNFVLQAGDPRGDGEGGPGFTLRDEFSPIPFLRGTVGMALAQREDGGSQFFITVSPQPHLNGRYTVFGRVVNGFEVLDQVSMLDVIERVRIWDGVTFK